MSNSTVHIGNDKETVEGVACGVENILATIALNQGELRMTSGDIKLTIWNFLKTQKVEKVTLNNCVISGSK